jgi:putative membrane protein insertion efficiency factor
MTGGSSRGVASTASVGTASVGTASMPPAVPPPVPPPGAPGAVDPLLPVRTAPISPPSGRVARMLVRLVEAYQSAFSWRPSPCRFVPSCSNYALEALEVHGARRGSWLALRRLGRCHPWGAHGEDPVPARSVPERKAS